MIRLFATLFAAMLLGGATPPRDWTATTTRTAEGSYVLGNPQAKVKLVEWASYTCSHCAHFSRDSAPVLKERMIRSGSTSLELRHLIRDRLDLAAVMLARCGGAPRFARTSAAIFAGQDAWLPRGAAWDAANAARTAKLAPGAQLKALADGAGLSAIAATTGVTPAAATACFADAAQLDRTIKAAEAVPEAVRATPTFFINGALVGPADWATLEPKLRAAGAR